MPASIRTTIEIVRLIVDSNILVRCSRGRAVRYVEELISLGVTLSTTERNADELYDRLRGVFGMSAEEASAEVLRVLEPVDLLALDEFEPYRPAADRRLRDGGKSDWPALAAALSLDCAIWSEDVDFFGTGVPVWSTANVLLCAAVNKD